MNVELLNDLSLHRVVQHKVHYWNLMTEREHIWAKAGYAPALVASSSRGPIWAFVGSARCSTAPRQVAFWHLPLLPKHLPCFILFQYNGALHFYTDISTSISKYRRNYLLKCDQRSLEINYDFKPGGPHRSTTVENVALLNCRHIILTGSLAEKQLIQAPSLTWGTQRLYSYNQICIEQGGKKFFTY